MDNFQCFMGRHCVNFSEGLNIIIGHGGKGKSKLFNAFNWALFDRFYITDFRWADADRLPHSANFKAEKYQLINMRSLSLASPGQIVECCVQLEIEDDRGDNYVIERKIEATRKDIPTPHDDKEIWDRSEAWDIPQSILKVTYHQPTGHVIKYNDDANNIIYDLFPKDFMNYNWFQGESIDDLINFNNEENLRDAIKHISYFPYYEKLTSIIDKSKEIIERQETRNLRTANANNTRIDSLTKRIEFIEGRIRDEKEAQQKSKDLIVSMQIALANDEGKIKGMAGLSKLIQKYDEYEIEIRNINEKLSKIDNLQRELLPSLWVLRGTSDLINKCGEIIRNHVEEEYTMPERKYLDNPSREKLEEILNHDHQCFVCGSKVDKDHPEQIKWIEKRLHEQDRFLREMEDYKNHMEESKRFNMFIGKIQDYPSRLEVAIDSIDNQYITSEEEINKLIEKRKTLERKKSEINNEIQALKTKAGINSDNEISNISIIDKSISASRTNIEKEQRKLQASKQAIFDYTKELNKTQGELSALGGTRGYNHVPETEWKNLSVFLLDICQNVREKAKKELMRKIEERANQYYKSFTQHERTYTGKITIINNSLQFDPLINTSHLVRKKMSIINALLNLNQEAMGVYYPFITDAPTSDFDRDAAFRYLYGLKDIFKQSIVITKDVEPNTEEFHNLANENRITRIYYLDSVTYGDDTGRRDQISSVIKTLK